MQSLNSLCRPLQGKADRRSQKLASNFSFIAALLEEGKAEFLHGHQPLDRRPALPVGIFLILGLQESFRVVLEDTHGRFACLGHETGPPRDLATRSDAQAFTVSKASAALVNRRAAKCFSIFRKNSSRSASVANSTATPRSLSGVVVRVARKSLQEIPRSPGNVVQPSWYSMLERQMSRFTTSRALSSINLRRASTFSPIRVVKISSAATASSSFTWSKVRVSAFMVVSQSCSAFISPRPLNRVMVKSFLASSTT